jgi:hypothetical protein
VGSLALEHSIEDGAANEQLDQESTTEAAAGAGAETTAGVAAADREVDNLQIVVGSVTVADIVGTVQCPVTKARQLEYDTHLGSNESK